MPIPLLQLEEASLWFCTLPGHLLHLPCQWVFWRCFADFGSMHEKGGKLSMFLAQVKIPASWLQSALWRDLTKVRSSAWTLQSITGGDSFPDFLLPYYQLPTIIFCSAFFRKIPHQKELLWKFIHSKRITSIHQQNPLHTFFSCNPSFNLMRYLIINT